MKPNQLFTNLLAATAVLVASCSATRMSQDTALQDDVFNSSVKAKEYIAMTPALQNLKADSVGTDAYYEKSYPYYDMDYTSRIDRFYYGSPWRSYFDNYADFYGYYAYRPYSFGHRFGGFYGDYNMGFVGNYLNYWAFYGAPYYNNFWGPFSFQNPYWGGYYSPFNPGWGGYYGGGYYGGTVTVRNRDNYAPRPIRGSENGINRGAAGTYPGTPTRSDAPRSRAEMYNPVNAGNAARPNSSSNAPSRAGNNDSRPTRTETQSRPSRGNDTPPPSRPTYTPPPTQQSAPPPSSSGSRGESGGGGGRPTRGGR